MEFVEFKVGTKSNWAGNKIYKITEYYELRDQEDFYIRLTEIINQDYEILSPKKKVGDLICKDVDCTKCPLRSGYCNGSVTDRLYDRLEQTFADIEDKEIHNILKARLDKEVEE